MAENTKHPTTEDREARTWGEMIPFDSTRGLLVTDLRAGQEFWHVTRGDDQRGVLLTVAEGRDPHARASVPSPRLGQGRPAHELPRVLTRASAPLSRRHDTPMTIYRVSDGHEAYLVTAPTQDEAVERYLQRYDDNGLGAPRLDVRRAEGDDLTTAVLPAEVYGVRVTTTQVVLEDGGVLALDERGRVFVGIREVEKLLAGDVVRVNGRLHLVRGVPAPHPSGHLVVPTRTVDHAESSATFYAGTSVVTILAE